MLCPTSVSLRIPFTRGTVALPLLLFFGVFAFAQGGDVFNAATPLATGYRTYGRSPLIVTVFAVSAKVLLDRQAVVKLTNQSTQNVSWQTTADKSEAAFAEVPFGKYDVEVSAVGYITAHKDLQVVDLVNGVQLDIVLQRDPAAIAVDVADSVLPSNARKHTKRGISALKSGNLKDAQRHLDAAYKVAPSNPDLNFLQGYLAYQQKDLGRAQSFLDAATNLNPTHVQALTLLGRLGLQQEDYTRATSALEKAVGADSEYWVAHDLLAGAYLRQLKYEKARRQAELALDKGKGSAGSAQLVLGQALVNLGLREQGIEALKTFVQTSPKNPTVPQVRDLIARLEANDSSSSTGNSLNNAASLPGIDPLAAAPEPGFNLQPWQPPGIDEMKPSTAANVVCPTQDVVQAASGRVKELVGDVSRIAAIEHLLHEQLDETGSPTTKQTRDFNYVVGVSEEADRVGVEEYRAEHLGLADFPDQIASSGFATLAFVFHPVMVDDYEMTCEGLGDWQGQATWLVHFRQREDRPARLHDFRVGGELYSLKLKGRAWITADKFQIVRIESDLVSPIPRIQLRSERQIVEYGPVPFQKKKVELWLPKSAEIYLDFRRHRYYRRHSFDHYMLFGVEAEEKRKEPVSPPAVLPN